MISRKNKFLFLRIPKSAGRSIALQIRPFCEQPKPADSLLYTKQPKIGWICHHWSYEEIVRYRPYVADYFSFAFVRNPWDRLHTYCHGLYLKQWPGRTNRKHFSKYLNKLIKKKLDVNEIVKTKPDARIGYFCFFNFQQIQFLTSDSSTNSDKISVDFIGRFENIQQDFRNAMDRFNLDGCKLKNIIGKRKSKRHYSQDYTQESVDMIAKQFKEDIEYFKYSYEVSP